MQNWWKFWSWLSVPIEGRPLELNHFAQKQGAFICRLVGWHFMKSACMYVYAVKPTVWFPAHAGNWIQILGVYSEGFTCNFIQPNMFTLVTLRNASPTPCSQEMSYLCIPSHLNHSLENTLWFSDQIVIYFTYFFNQECIRKSSTIRPLQTKHSSSAVVAKASH